MSSPCIESARSTGIDWIAGLEPVRQRPQVRADQLAIRPRRPAQLDREGPLGQTKPESVEYPTLRIQNDLNVVPEIPQANPGRGLYPTFQFAWRDRADRRRGPQVMVVDHQIRRVELRPLG